MRTPNEQQRLFEDWKAKQDDKLLFTATLKQCSSDLKKVIRIVTKYDNLMQDVIDCNQQYVSEPLMETELHLCVRLLCRTLDELFE